MCCRSAGHLWGISSEFLVFILYRFIYSFFLNIWSDFSVKTIQITINFYPLIPLGQEKKTSHTHCYHSTMTYLGLGTLLCYHIINHIFLSSHTHKIHKIWYPKTSGQGSLSRYISVCTS